MEAPVYVEEDEVDQTSVLVYIHNPLDLRRCRLPILHFTKSDSYILIPMQSETNYEVSTGLRRRASLSHGPPRRVKKRTEPDLRDAEQQAPLQGSIKNETVKGRAQPINETDNGKQENLDKRSAVEEMDETVLQLLKEIATQCNVSADELTEQDLRDAVKQATIQESTEDEVIKVGSQLIHGMECGKQQDIEKGKVAGQTEENYVLIDDEDAKLCNGVSCSQRTEPDVRDAQQKAPFQDTTENVETVTVLSQPIHELGFWENESVARVMDEEDGLGAVQDEGAVFKTLAIEEANIQALREKVNNFSQQVSELVKASEVHILDALNAFTEEIMQFHQKGLEIFEEEIEGLRNVDTLNDDRSSFHLGKARNVFTGFHVAASPDHLQDGPRVP